MSAHTPGPWKMIKGADDDETRCAVVQDNGDKEWLIATVENGAPGDCLATESANAHLIAAAPDLLAALKELAAYLQIEEIWTIEAEVAMVDRAEAALAKAEGRS